MVFEQTHGLSLLLLLTSRLLSPHFRLKMKTGEETGADKEEMENMITGCGQRNSRS